MLLFLVIPFVVGGVVVFGVFAIVPPARKYALSAALWCLALMPGAAMVGVGELSFGLMVDNRRGRAVYPSLTYSVLHALASPVAKGLLTAAGILLCVGLATAIASVHQWLMHRTPLALFRIYAGLVVAGIALLAGLMVTVAGGSEGLGYWHSMWPAALVSVFGGVGAGVWTYWHAASLRGAWPFRFTWVTKAEFEGTL